VNLRQWKIEIGCAEQTPSFSKKLGVLVDPIPLGKTPSFFEKLGVWAVRAGLMPLLLVLLLILAGCGGGEPSAPPPAASADATGVTVETGGMALPAPAGAAGADQPPAEPPPAAAERPVIPVGSLVTASATAAVYAAPDRAAPRFAEYAAGSRLTVVEPDGDWTAYPVAVEGERWVRVRAEDGLVGWVMEDALAE